MDAYVICMPPELSAASLSRFTFTSTIILKMLRGVARISLRRGIHTTGPVSSAVGLSRYRFAMAAGASVIAASYLGWRISLENRGIALDADSARMIGFLTFVRLIEASLARPKPKTVTTQSSSLAPSSETLSAAPPPSDAAAQSQEDRVDEKADGIPSEDGDEESSGGAFDPVTGKINWDCPCLGGMAYGPCGMQFREAFSCFVYSEEEPKGIDCVEKFKAMQDCFRENPDVYGDGTHELVGIYIPQQTILLFIQKF
jgi:mitochondrial intermembrane space import and assembly protein 40